MDTYLLVNLFFLCLVLLTLRVRKFSKAQLLTLGALIVMTAVFDSIIIGMNIVGYDSSKILGIYVGNAPIEDFFYAILAVIMIPTIWQFLERHHEKRI